MKQRILALLSAIIIILSAPLGCYETALAADPASATADGVFYNVKDALIKAVTLGAGVTLAVGVTQSDAAVKKTAELISASTDNYLAGLAYAQTKQQLMSDYGVRLVTKMVNGAKKVYAVGQGVIQDGKLFVNEKLIQGLAAKLQSEGIYDQIRKGTIGTKAGSNEARQNILRAYSDYGKSVILYCGNESKSTKINATPTDKNEAAGYVYYCIYSYGNVSFYKKSLITDNISKANMDISVSLWSKTSGESSEKTVDYNYGWYYSNISSSKDVDSTGDIPAFYYGDANNGASKAYFDRIKYQLLGNEKPFSNVEYVTSDNGIDAWRNKTKSLTFKGSSIATGDAVSGTFTGIPYSYNPYKKNIFSGNDVIVPDGLADGTYAGEKVLPWELTKDAAGNIIVIQNPAIGDVVNAPDIPTSPALGLTQENQQSKIISGDIGADIPDSLPYDQEQIKQWIKDGIAEGFEDAIPADTTTDKINEGSKTDTGESSATNIKIGDQSAYMIQGLEEVFPFCLPFDFVKLLKVFNADPVAPSFSLKIFWSKTHSEIPIDLSNWESVAVVVRSLETIGFIALLIFATSKLIKW